MLAEYDNLAETCWQFADKLKHFSQLCLAIWPILADNLTNSGWQFNQFWLTIKPILAELTIITIYSQGPTRFWLCATTNLCTNLWQCQDWQSNLCQPALLLVISYRLGCRGSGTCRKTCKNRKQVILQSTLGAIANSTKVSKPNSANLGSCEYIHQFYFSQIKVMSNNISIE